MGQDFNLDVSSIFLDHSVVIQTDYYDIISRYEMYELGTLTMAGRQEDT